MASMSLHRISGMWGIVCLISTSFAQTAPANSPDRTGEKDLRSLFAQYGRLGSLQASIRQSKQEEAGGPFYFEQEIDFAYGGGSRFRVAQSSYWGEVVHMWSDGKIFVRDALDTPARWTLSDAQGAIDSTFFALTPGQSAGSLLFLMLDGERGFSRTVAENGPIVYKRDGQNRGFYFFLTKQCGACKMVVERVNGQALVTEIVYDNRRWSETGEVLDSKWFDAPGVPLTSQVLTYDSVNKKLDQRLFRTEAPRDVVVDDRRKKR